MNFTIATVARSLADYLAPVMPGTIFYEDPNQQDTRVPCMFLQQRYSYLEKRQARRWLRRIGLDLTYLEDYNLPNMQQLYQQAAQTLDLALETFPYFDGKEEGTTLLRTYDRDWKIDLDALHYQFELRVWIELPETFTPMQTMDYHEEVVDGG